MERSLQCIPDTLHLKSDLQMYCSDPQFDVCVLFENLSVPVQHFIFTGSGVGESSTLKYQEKANNKQKVWQKGAHF